MHYTPVCHLVLDWSRWFQNGHPSRVARTCQHAGCGDGWGTQLVEYFEQIELWCQRRKQISPARGGALPGMCQATGDESVPLRRVARGVWIRLLARAQASEKKRDIFKRVIPKALVAEGQTSVLLSRIWNPCMSRSVSQSFYRFSRSPPTLLLWLKIMLIKNLHCNVSLVYRSKHQKHHLIWDIPPITSRNMSRYCLDPESGLFLNIERRPSWSVPLCIRLLKWLKFLLHLALSRGDRRLVWWSRTLSGDPLLMILWKWLFPPHLYSIGDVLRPLEILSNI